MLEYKIFKDHFYRKSNFLIICIFLVFAVSSCKSHKKTIKPEKATTEEIISVKKNKGKGDEIGERIAQESKKWIGTPYKYGHQEKGKSTDCSGMVYVLYLDIANIELPRNSAKQADFCDEIKEKNIKPGDLVFFATGKDPKQISHVGIMLDRIKFVHASGSKGVIMSEMTTPYYQRTFIKYGRVPGM